ncbi:MAG: lysylphosphatidylglycerol synthase transmembrane domain-containing protein [Gammaproteobacteria bacterium]
MLKEIPAWMVTLSQVLVSLLLLLLCLYVVDFEKLFITLNQIHPGLFLLAFLINVCGTVFVRAWIAYLTTHASGLQLGYPELLRINLIARFYTIALPRGAAAAVRWHHYKIGGSGHAAAALLVFENLISILTLFISAGLILLYESDKTGGPAGILLPVSWGGAIASTVMLLPFLHKASAVFLENILRPLSRRHGYMKSLIEKLFQAVNDYQNISGAKILGICVFSLFGYALFILSAWILAEGMGLGLGLLAIAWIRSLTLLVSLLPITVAGVGLREGTIILLMQGYGVDASVAFAYALASFAIQLLIGLMGAIAEAFRVFGPIRTQVGKQGRGRS